MESYNVSFCDWFISLSVMFSFKYLLSIHLSTCLSREDARAGRRAEGTGERASQAGSTLGTEPMRGPIPQPQGHSPS